MHLVVRASKHLPERYLGTVGNHHKKVQKTAYFEKIHEKHGIKIHLAVTGLGAPLSSSVLKRRYIGLKIIITLTNQFNLI